MKETYRSRVYTDRPAYADFEAIRNIGEYQRGWHQGRKDTMQAYEIKEG